MKPTQIAIYGAGGFARTVAWHVRACNRKEQKYEIVCLISDVPNEHGKIIHEIPVLNLDEAYERYPLARVVRGIGVPKDSESIMDKAATKGFGFEYQRSLWSNKQSQWLSDNPARHADLSGRIGSSG